MIIDLTKHKVMSVQEEYDKLQSELDDIKVKQFDNQIRSAQLLLEKQKRENRLKELERQIKREIHALQNT